MFFYVFMVPVDVVTVISALKRMRIESDMGQMGNYVRIVNNSGKTKLSGDVAQPYQKPNSVFANIPLIVRYQNIPRRAR